MMTPAGNSSYPANEVMPIVYDTISTFIHNIHYSAATAARPATTQLSIVAISILLVQLTSATYEI
jgi:hypothetical protein